MVDGFKKILDQQQAMMQSTYAIGALLAIAILFNTLLINLSERDAELEVYGDEDEGSVEGE